MNKYKYFLTAFTFLLIAQLSIAQDNLQSSLVNIRASFLLYPSSPLLTIEFKTIDKLSIQLESNFNNTHGLNLKYFKNSLMSKDYYFVGLAFVKNNRLREDENTVYLPYMGYGYASRFGSKDQWLFDNRIGIGPSLNADQNIIAPIVKTGIGYVISK